MTTERPLGGRSSGRFERTSVPALRILVANHTPVLGSGSGTYCAEVARGLARAGHHVVVFTPGPASSRHDDGVVWVEEPVRRDGRFPSYSGHPASSLTYDSLTDEELAAYRAALSAALQSIVVGEHIDLVHAQHLGFLAVEAASTGVPVIVTSHGSELELLGRARGPGWADWYTVARSLASRTVSVSGAVRVAVQRILGPEAPVGPVIGNGFDPTTFTATGAPPHSPPGSGSATAVIGGRMVAYKRLDLALSSLAMARDLTGVDIHVDVVGDGPLRAEVAGWARASGLPCRFFGYLDQVHLAEQMRRARLFVSPAVDEPFGLLALEAAATGCPVVIARRSGLAELVDSASGQVVDGTEPGAWAHAIAQELGSHRDRQTVSLSVAELTWDAVVGELLAHHRHAPLSRHASIEGRPAP